MNLEGSPYAKYKILRTLGHGTFGIVYLVKTPDQKELVIKSISLDTLSNKRQQRSLKEVSILESQSHPHLISYLSSTIHSNKLLILMEYAPGGDLQQLINIYKNNRIYLSEKTIWNIIYEICLGVEYLHGKGIIHRDIKCLNILLDKEKRVKIADMGVCKTVKKNDTIEGSEVGTPLYLSPEIIQHKPYDTKVDIWAIGCVAYNLAALEPPFQAENLISLARLIVKARPKPLPSSYSSKLYEFVLRLMDKRASTRPEISEVIELIPGYIKNAYIRPSVHMNILNDIIEAPPAIISKPPKIPRPVTANSKDRVGSISKYPDRFKMYLMLNSRMTTSRSLCMKPMQNSLLKSQETFVDRIEPKVQQLRPTSGVIRRDLDMQPIPARPSSAYNYKRTTIRDLEP